MKAFGSLVYKPTPSACCEHETDMHCSTYIVTDAAHHCAITHALPVSACAFTAETI